MFIFLFIFVLITDICSCNLDDLTPHGNSGLTYEKCLSMKKVFYEDQCWELLSEVPCDKGQWLVLDWSDDNQQEQLPVKVKCTKRRCSKSDVYWPWDGFCYNMETARRRKLCPHPDTELTTDEFGDGYCKCHMGGQVPYVRVVSTRMSSDEDTQPCYPMYAKGPCPQNHVLTPFGWGYGNCTVDICSAKRHQNVLRLSLRWEQQQQQPTMVPWTDGQCYELGKLGPCAGNDQFIILQDVMRPGCISKATKLDLFSNKKSSTTEATPCKTDHRGKCVDGVDFQTSDLSFGFEEQLRESAQRHRKQDKKKKKRTP